MKLIPFGDSHCLFLAGAEAVSPRSVFPDDTPEVHWMGPAKIWGLTHHSVNQTKEKFLQLCKGPLTDSDATAIAALGEIDIRVNLGRQCCIKGDFSPVSKLVDVYLNVLNSLPSRSIIIWGPPPTTYEAENLAYPATLDALSRNALNHLFHKEIISRINEYPKLKFASLFYNFVDDSLQTCGGLVDGIHYSLEHCGTARDMFRHLINSDSKVIIDLVKYQKFPKISFQYSQNLMTGFSSHLLEIINPKPLRFFLHRVLPNSMGGCRSIQLRPQFVDEIIDNPPSVHSFPITNTLNALVELFSTGNQAIRDEILSLIQDYESIESNFFNEIGSAEIEILQQFKRQFIES